MYKLAIFSVLAFMACNSSKQMSSSKNSDGFISLFDGTTTSGWHSHGKSVAGKAWKAEDGALHLDPAVKEKMPGEGGDLLTNEEFENYHLKLEWKISPKGNSGIIFNVHEDTSKYKQVWFTGPEMQVLDNGSATVEGHPDAKIKTHRAGDLYDLMTSKELVKPAGEWNQVEIVANKGKLEFYMNGQLSLSTTMWDDNWKKMVAGSKFKSMPDFGTYKKGKIALQDHGDEVWFRNIQIKKL